MLGLTGVTSMAVTVQSVTVVEPDTFVCESVSVAVIVIVPVTAPAVAEGAVTSPVESTVAIASLDEVQVRKDSKNVTPSDNIPVPVSWRAVPMAMPVSEGVIVISLKWLFVPQLTKPKAVIASTATITIKM